MTGLTPGKTYSVSVTSTDMLGNTVTQALPDFSTPPVPGVQVPAVTQPPSVHGKAKRQSVGLMWRWNQMVTAFKNLHRYYAGIRMLVLSDAPRNQHGCHSGSD